MKKLASLMLAGIFSFSTISGVFAQNIETDYAAESISDSYNVTALESNDRQNGGTGFLSEPGNGSYLFYEGFDDDSFISGLQKLRPSAEGTGSGAKGVDVFNDSGELVLKTQNYTTGGQRPVRYSFENPLTYGSSDGFEIGFKFKLDTIIKREAVISFTESGTMSLEPYSGEDKNIFSLFIGGSDTSSADNITMVNGKGIMRAVAGGVLDGTSASKQILRVTGGNDAMFTEPVQNNKYVSVNAKIDKNNGIALVTAEIEGGTSETITIELPDGLADKIGALTITNGMKASTGTSNPSMRLDDIYVKEYTSDDVTIIKKERDSNTFRYTAGIRSGLNGDLIFSAYDESGRLVSVDTKEIDGKTETGELNMPQNSKGKVNIMIWDKINSLKPGALAVTDTWSTEETKIELNYNTYPLVVGNNTGDGSTVTLKAYLSNDEFSENEITWTSSNPDIQITSSGAEAVVRGNRTGYAEVTAELPNGQSAKCLITVIDNISRSTVADLRLNTDKLNLAVGGEAKIYAFASPDDYFGNGYMDKSFEWKSSDENVVSVDENGNLKANTEGSAIITVKSNDVGRETECEVKVVNKEDLQPSDELPFLDTTPMQVGETRYVGEGNWVSSNTYIADIHDGYLTAYANTDKLVIEDGKPVYTDGKASYESGTVDIVATDINGGETAIYPIEISDAPTEVQSVTIDKKSVSMPLGSSAELTVAANPASLLNKGIEWYSSDEGVVSVSESGFTVDGAAKAEIKAEGIGTAYVTAKLGDKENICDVTVTDGIVNISSINIEDFKEIDVDEVYRLEPVISEDKASDKELIWLSTNRDVVTVNNEGIIMGYKDGTANIYAIAKDSLTDQQRNEVDELADTGLRSIEGDNEDTFNSILASAIYGKCNVSVKNSSDYLRNLHIPKETITNESVQLMWTRASMIDAVGLSKYRIYCNDKLIGSTDKLSYTVTGLEANTEYEFKVEALSGENILYSSSVTAETKENPTAIINVMEEPYNAKGDGYHTDTYAIQRAINDCPDGGMVYVPEGFYYSGALFLKSNMTFKVDGVIIGSIRPNDYPDIVTRWEGWRKIYKTVEDGWDNYTELVPVCDTNRYANSSLLNAGVYYEGEAGKSSPYNVSDITVIGKGELNANGFSLAYYEGPNTNETSTGGMSPKVKTLADDPTLRGRTVTLHNAQNVYFSGVTASFSPGWCVHPIYCDSVSFDGMNVITKANNKHLDGANKQQENQILNGDGIDPESCSRVNITNVWFYTGDDNIAMKSGRNKEGNELDKPNSYIRVTDTTAENCKGGYCIGSEMAAGAHDVLFQNVSTTGYLNLPGLWIKAPKARGGVIEDITYRDCDINGASRGISFELAYDDGNGFTNVNPAKDIPYVRNIMLDNVYGSNRNGIYLLGDASRKITGITLRGVNLTGGKNSVKYCEYTETD